MQSVSPRIGKTMLGRMDADLVRAPCAAWRLVAADVRL